MQNLPAYDNAPALAWLDSQKKIPELSGGAHLHPQSIYTVSGEHELLCGLDIDYIVGRFPAAALARSSIREIVVEDRMWVKKGSSQLRPILTDFFPDAVSCMHFMTAHTHRGAYEQHVMPTQIQLFNIPGGYEYPRAADHVAARWNYSRKKLVEQGLAREIAYNIVAPAAFTPDYTLQFLDGRTTSGLAILDCYADQCEIAEPVSNRAAAFRGPHNSLNAIPDPRERLSAICEEFSEAIAARILGFAFKTGSYGIVPLQDNLLQRYLVDRFLDATQVDAEPSDFSSETVRIKPTEAPRLTVLQ